MISPRTHALRYRIWAYASPREWNVTLAEIAEGIGESMATVRSCVARTPAWYGRFRGFENQNSEWRMASWQAGTDASARHIAQDLIAGRVNMEA